MTLLSPQVTRMKWFIIYLFNFQTGPKGVINDWREYKRLETEKRAEQEREKQALAKKLQLTCRSHVGSFYTERYVQLINAFL